ncbi:CxC2 domain-containing protein [Mycena indigotica]|uniref:CxC2 domain-containing protein n=1 Tax=Mycena indigotica TaxID=2126181 RepID=A0A8H6SQN5_9AGAR|nr:CxC2 domain-containing protein [Mycena indigotica]KAF7303726.1 CxC2 domain-containing protein [Mycena indigotica]
MNEDNGRGYRRDIHRIGPYSPAIRTADLVLVGCWKDRWGKHRAFVEPTYSIPASWSTKEMGEGARDDVLEDKIDLINFEKNRSMGQTLARRLIVAVAERQRQGIEFQELDDSIPKKKRCEWAKMMDAWYKDNTQTNPFEVQGGKLAGPSEREISEELKRAEVEDARAGIKPLLKGKMTMTAFIRAGMQLQAIQYVKVFIPQTLFTIPRRRIRTALKAKKSADQASQIQELRLSLIKQMRTFEKLQLTYMPGVQGLRDAARYKLDAENAQPESAKLYLPSQLTAEECRQVSMADLIETEAKLRWGQCADALAALRGRLHSKQHMIWFRGENMVGQRARTRSVTLMARMEEGVTKAAAKYTEGYEALVHLKGKRYAPEFQKLDKTHLNTRIEIESDAARSLRTADGSRPMREETAAKKKKTKMAPIS